LNGIVYDFDRSLTFNFLKSYQTYYIYVSVFVETYYQLVLTYGYKTDFEDETYIMNRYYISRNERKNLIIDPK